MKKAFIHCLTGLYLVWTITNTTYAHTLPIKTNFRETSKKISAADTGYTDSLTWNEINSNAIRNFTRDYKNVSNVQWYKSAKGIFVAYFTSEEIRNWVYYSKKGDYMHMIRYYHEENLSADVCHLIKSTFYDYSIYCVIELSAKSQTAYHVKIVDRTNWKTIKVVNGEMEVTEEYVEK